MDKDKIKELTLIMMYLTSWQERNEFTNDNDCLTWKGYDFNNLNMLDNEKYISLGNHPYRSKKAYLTKDGIEKAKELMKKYYLD